MALRSPIVPNAAGVVREAMRVAPARPNISAGLRAALAATAPMVLATVLHRPELVWTSLAGFGTVLVDKGGAYRTRAETMAAYALGGGAATLFGTLAAPHPVAAVALLVAVVTVCGFVRLFGAEATSVGVSVAVAVVVALSLPVRAPTTALVRTGYFALGCAWAAAGSLLLWPLRPFRPARAAVAASLREVAGYAAALPALSRAGLASAQRREHVGRVRQAIVNARATLGTLRRGHVGASRRGEQLLVVLEGGDQLFGTLVAIELALATQPTDATRAMLERVDTELRRLADAMEAERPLADARAAASGPTRADALPMLARARDELDDLVAVARGLDTPGAPAHPGRPELDALLPTRGSHRALFRANLSLDSATLRHGLRISVSTAAALLVARALGLGHGYWASVTCLVVLQPHGVATFAKALQRVGGTLIGAALAIAVATFVHDPRAILVAVFGFAALSVALLPLNYGAYAVFLTPSFVLLAELGAGGGALARARVVNTLLGAAIALLGARALFPLAERDQFRPLMAAVLDALGELVAVAAQRPGSPVALKAARSRVGLALLNAEASFQRLLTETASPAAEHEALLALLVYAHRLAAGLIALAVGATDAQREALARRAPALGASLAELRDAVSHGRALGPDAVDATGDDEDLERLAHQLTVQRAAWRRWCASHGAAPLTASPGRTRPTRTSSRPTSP